MLSTLHFLSAGLRFLTLPGVFVLLTMQRYGVLGIRANVCAVFLLFWSFQG